MNDAYRPVRRNRNLPSRVADGWVNTVLTPDITTARDRPAVASNRAAGAAAAPAPVAQRPVRPERATAPGDTSILEASHPDIARAIALLWGYPEMNDYFDRLWMADGQQGPIDPDAMSELMLLSRVHQAIVPHRPGRNLSAFYGANPLGQAGNRPADPWRDVPPRR